MAYDFTVIYVISRRSKKVLSQNSEPDVPPLVQLRKSRQDNKF